MPNQLNNRVRNLKIGHFLSTSEYAVHIQVALALIAHVLLSLARQACTAIASPPILARLVRITSCTVELSTVSKHLIRPNYHKQARLEFP